MKIVFELAEHMVFCDEWQVVLLHNISASQSIKLQLWRWRHQFEAFLMDSPKNFKKEMMKCYENFCGI